MEVLYSPSTHTSFKNRSVKFKKEPRNQDYIKTEKNNNPGHKKS